MKKVFVLVLLIVPCFALSSLDLGFGADVTVDRVIEKSDSFKATETHIELVPALVLMMSPQTELRPFAIIGLHKESDPDAISGPIAADLSQFYIGVGAGYYYHFLQGQVISLLAGPRASVVLTFAEQGTSAPVYDSYLFLELALSLPVYLDVQLKENLFMRAGVEIPGIQFETERIEDGGVTETSSTLSFQDYFFNFTIMYIGFYLML